MKITLIAAMDKNQLIGKDGDLPWRLPADLRFFKQQTMGKTLLMGRTTCESLPFALPGRDNFVLSRSKSFTRAGFKVIQQLTDLPESLDELMVIGGASIYQMMLPQATNLIITHIQHAFDGDTHFPEVNWNNWKKQRVTHHPIHATNNPDYDFEFVCYKRAHAKTDKQTPDQLC